MIADPVGAQNASKNSVCCALDARWVLYGFLGGSMCQNLDIGFILRKRVSLIGTTLKSRSIEYKARLLVDLANFIFGKDRQCI
jgi:tumor protein p53-inducible protein 3